MTIVVSLPLSLQARHSKLASTFLNYWDIYAHFKKHAANELLAMLSDTGAATMVVDD